VPYGSDKKYRTYFEVCTCRFVEIEPVVTIKGIWLLTRSYWMVLVPVVPTVNVNGEGFLNGKHHITVVTKTNQIYLKEARSTKQIAIQSRRRSKSDLKKACVYFQEAFLASFLIALFFKNIKQMENISSFATFPSSGSFATMAQAMIENNEFRSSHQDLTIWTMGGSGEEEEGNPNNSNDMYNNDSDNDRQEDPSPPPNMATAFEEALVKNSNNDDSTSNNRNDSSSPGRSPSIIRTDQNTSNNSHKRSEGRSVVIQVPPKRQKIIDPSVTARSLAHGKSLTSLALLALHVL